MRDEHIQRLAANGGYPGMEKGRGKKRKRNFDGIDASEIGEMGGLVLGCRGYMGTCWGTCMGKGKGMRHASSESSCRGRYQK